MNKKKSTGPKAPSSTRQKRRAPRRKSAQGKRSAASRLRVAILHLLIWSFSALAAYALWLGHEAVRIFEAHQWSLPARVYGRPLELFPGARVSRERLERELVALGYQRRERPQSSGQYAVSASAVEFSARGYPFWDGAESRRRVIARFDNGKIGALRNAVSGEPVALMRIEPREIGRINPRRFEDRKPVRFEDLPPRFVEALVEIEDRRFFEHFGVDPLGLARAMVRNVQARRWVEGGSTLTQQLVKNFYLSRDRTIRRKLVEMVMAIALELRFEKERILETYVNEVFLGQDGNRAVHGFELAAQFYFGRPLAELDWSQQALLIGMVKGPSAYDPRRHPEAARARRNVVLDVLNKRGIVERADAASMRAGPLGTEGRASRDFSAQPAFMALIKRQLQQSYSDEDLTREGLSIYTSLDPDLQTNAELAVAGAVDDLEARGHAGLQVGMVIADPSSGQILGLVGDRRPAYAGFNRAVDAVRPVGSTIKPFIYAAALENPRHYHLASMIADEPVTWEEPGGGTWEPNNFDGRPRGRLALLDALTRSLNLAVVNLGRTLGLATIESVFERLDEQYTGPFYPSMLLGAIELSPLQLAQMYTVFANDGYLLPLRAITTVTDQTGRELTRYGMDVRKVFEPETAALTRFALTRVVEQGTGRLLAGTLQRALPLAGKTGTTDDNRDSWFVGFGADRLAATWVGRDDNRPTGLTGSTGALPVWLNVMRAVGIEPLREQSHAALQWLPVDLAHGVVLPDNCASAERIPFHRDSNPPRAASCDGRMRETSEGVETPGLFDRLRGMLFGR